MADQFTNVTNITEQLKYVYGEGLQNQFNDEVTTYNQFEKSDRKPLGLGYQFGVRRARVQSIGGRLDGAELPMPFTGKKDKGIITPVYVYASLRLSGPAIARGKRDLGAFVDTMSDEMDDIYQAFKVDMNRQAWADGFGLLGYTTAAATPSVSATWTAVFDNIQYFQEGMLVDFFNAAGTTASTTCCGQRVSSIDPSTKTVTFEISGQTYLAHHPNATIKAYTNDATELASGVMAVVSGSRLPTHAATDQPTDITGLEGIYDDGTLLDTFEDISADDLPFWRATILSNSSVDRELTIDLMLQGVDVARVRSGMKINKIRMGLGQKRKYFGLLAPDVRFAPANFKGGYETLAFAAGDGTIEMVVDPVAQPEKIYMEPNGVIKKYELEPLGWGDLDGSKMHRVSSYDQWDSFLRLYTQLGCEQRNCLVKISDLAEPSLYS